MIFWTEIRRTESEDNNMTSDNMKVVKFETIIKDLWTKLGGCRQNSQGNNPLKILLGDMNNKYAQIVIENSFDTKRSTLNCYYNLYEDNVIKLIEDCRLCNSKRPNGCSAKCNLSNQIVFFGLIALAIDNDSYNEKLSVITDFAYLLDFNENTIADWVFGVKAVLMAERIDITQMNTDRAIEFFSYLQ